MAEFLEGMQQAHRMCEKYACNERNHIQEQIDLFTKWRKNT